MYNNQFPSSDVQGFNSQFQVPFNRPPEVVGEGEVVPANALDGSVQLYFVPVLRKQLYPLHQGYFTSTYSVPASLECWYIRSICNENPTAFLSYRTANVSVHTPPVCENQIFTTNFMRDSNCNSFGNQYFQKFHNDHSTSTTDIIYFYPSLRCGVQKLSISAAVQTELNNFVCRSCQHEFAANNPGNANEDMCVDAPRPKSTYPTIECSGEKSFKRIATHTDASSNCPEGVCRQTQTTLRVLERSDVIATDEYVPRRKARRPRSESCSTDCSCTDLL